MILAALVYKTLDYLKKICWTVCVQCWKAAVFLLAWFVNTTTEFKVKIFIAILLTFATDFHKGVYEKYAEGADAWQMLKAGLDAMVIIIIARLFHFLVRQLITVILAVTHVLRAHSRGYRPSSSDAKRIGMDLRKRYMAKHDGKSPPKHEQLCDGRVTWVNSYTEKDRELVEASIRSYFSCGGSSASDESM